MFDLLKMLFYTFVAVIVGVFIGTVPVGGRTIGERITAYYKSSSEVAGEAGAKPKAAAKAARAAPKKAAARSRTARPAVITAGAANSPDGHTAEDREALDRLIANRTKN